MNRLLALLVVFGLTSCSVKDEYYYQSHPKALQKALKLCPQTAPQGITCDQLLVLARRINNLAYELQLNLQDFGLKILFLQQQIATQQAQLDKDSSNKALQARLAKNKRDLSEHLAVVKWLESPAS